MAQAKSKVANTDKPENNPPPNPAPKGIFNIAKQTFSGFMNDNCLVLAAAIAYTAVQSVVPLLLGFVAVGSLFLQDPKTKQDFISGIESSIPKDVSKSIDLSGIINDFVAGATTISIIAILLLLWSGSGIFGQIKFAINQTFEVKKDPRNPIFQIGLQLFMLVVLGGLIILAAAISIIAGLIVNANVSLFGISPGNFSFIIPLLSYIVPFLLEIAVFASLYKLSPGRKGVRWKLVLIGGVLATILFEILKVFMGIYVNSFGAATSAQKTYGAIGGIFVFLFFLYATGAVILMGAELVAVLQGFKGVPIPAESNETKAVVAAPPRVARFVKRASDTTTISNIPVRPSKPNPVTALVGGFVLVIAVIFSVLTGRGSKA